MTLKSAPCYLVPLIILAGCHSGPSGTDGIPTALAPCPSSPNCVSSQAAPGDERHIIEPLMAEGATAADWQRLIELIPTLPGASLERSETTYLHATFRSKLFRFVDDLECLRLENGRIDVRSASRVGYSDLGVNRKRVEQIRSKLQSSSDR